jgi:signal transduction histidine kinase
MVDRYPVLIAAVVIYLYYLLTSVNFFKHHTADQSLLDYFMQFDSLLFLWLAAAALIQVQKMRKFFKQEQARTHSIERLLDRQQIQTQLVNDITMLLQDNVNNPLAVIAVTTQEIRRKFQEDAEILRWLDRIDGAMQRIHNTIRDLQAYESAKVMESSSEAMKQEVSA